jgi:FixJ family two-component response regulator
MGLATACPPSETRAMDEAPATVIVIDDDVGLREALGSLLRSVGLQASLHGSVSEFLAVGRPDGPSCLVLDVRLPGQGGLDFQRELTSGGIHLPIVFITGHGDIQMSVQAMKGGAIEFLTKPFRDQDLLDAIQSGLERDRSHRQKDEAIGRLRDRFSSLTQREREVMALVVAGRLNKQIAGEIGVSEITVKVHRGSLMKKMEAASVVDLVLMAEKLRASGDVAPP